jgi:hypothetical protein
MIAGIAVTPISIDQSPVRRSLSGTVAKSDQVDAFRNQSRLLGLEIADLRRNHNEIDVESTRGFAPLTY